MNDGFMVFWIDGDCVTRSRHFYSENMTLALKLMDELRKNSENSYVSMASQNSSSIGKTGVSSVEDGKLPSGEEYDWSKAGRAGKMRKQDVLKIFPKRD